MFNLLQIIGLKASAGMDASQLAASLAEKGAALSGAVSSQAGATLPRDLNGGALMWRIAFSSEEACRAALTSAQWAAHIAPELECEAVVFDHILYRPDHRDVSAGRNRAGIWRCLVLSVDAGSPRDEVRQFERDMLLMPRHVSTIRNWALGGVVSSQGRRGWSYVWEQEFDDVAGLEGEYMIHPIHWGLVDGWFDPECPQRIVDPLLIHAAFTIEKAVIR